MSYNVSGYYQQKINVQIFTFVEDTNQTLTFISIFFKQKLKRNGKTINTIL